MRTTSTPFTAALARLTLAGLTLSTFALSGAGCAAPLHTEMLGESIAAFSLRWKAPVDAKVWIAGPADSKCDTGCQLGCGKVESKGALGGGGGLFGGLGGGGDGSSSYDKLAYEVFTNFLTTKKKMRVIETHRHNYWGELNVETRKKIELLDDKNKASTMSCEDLCLLDEAKKRKADKVLAYHILEISGDQLTIHFRLSDVPTGLVEASQTLKVENLHARDFSYGRAGGGRASVPKEPVAGDKEPPVDKD